MNSVCIDCERCSQFIGGLSSIFGLVIKTIKKMRKVALFLSMMFVLSMGVFASIYVITPYQWDKETEVLSLDITTVENEFVLNLAEAYSNLWIRITDADGAVWHEETVDVPVGTYVISVANLPNGFYQLILTTEEGMIRTITFVKQ